MSRSLEFAKPTGTDGMKDLPPTIGPCELKLIDNGRLAEAEVEAKIALEKAIRRR